METLTMLVLFIPFVALVFLTIRQLTDDDIWLAAWLTVAGVLLSSIVSAPLRQVLLVLGKLVPNRRWEKRRWID